MCVAPWLCHSSRSISCLYILKPCVIVSIFPSHSLIHLRLGDYIRKRKKKNRERENQPTVSESLVCQHTTSWSVNSSQIVVWCRACQSRSRKPERRPSAEWVGVEKRIRKLEGLEWIYSSKNFLFAFSLENRISFDVSEALALVFHGYPMCHHLTHWSSGTAVYCVFIITSIPVYMFPSKSITCGQVFSLSFFISDE